MVKKILLFLLPPLFAIAAFVVFVLSLNKDTGKGALQVTASPKSAVFLNDKLIGETPLCKCEGQDMLATGSYTVRLVPKEGDFTPYQEHITVGSSVLTVVDRIFGIGAMSEGKVITLTKLSNVNAVELSILSFPEDITVYADNNEIGKTPLKITTLTASDHELRLVRDGYREKKIRIKLVAGYRVTLVATMGIMLDLESKKATESAILEPIASSSAIPTVSKVVILKTPTGFLRVRDNGSLSGKEIGRVSPGEVYDIVEEKVGWLSITLKDGQVGWVSSNYTKKQ